MTVECVAAKTGFFWGMDADEYRLRPEEVATICHYFRRAGGKGCTEAIKTTAEWIGVGLNKMRKLKKFLERCNIITIIREGHGTDLIKVNPIGQWLSRKECDRIRGELKPKKRATPLTETVSTPPRGGGEYPPHGNCEYPPHGGGETKESNIKNPKKRVPPYPPKAVSEPKPRQAQTTQKAQIDPTHPASKCEERFKAGRPAKLPTPWQGHPNYEQFVAWGAGRMKISEENLALMLVNARRDEERNEKALMLWDRFSGLPAASQGRQLTREETIAELDRLQEEEDRRRQQELSEVL